MECVRFFGGPMDGQEADVALVWPRFIFGCADSSEPWDAVYDLIAWEPVLYAYAGPWNPHR